MILHNASHVLAYLHLLRSGKELLKTRSLCPVLLALDDFVNFNHQVWEFAVEIFVRTWCVAYFFLCLGSSTKKHVLDKLMALVKLYTVRTFHQLSNSLPNL